MSTVAHGGPRIRLSGPLGRLHGLYSSAVRATERAIPSAYNPLTQAGAIANALFVTAALTGVLLLFWYTPSTTGAYSSVEAMVNAPLTAGLMRSLHRYSSDGCVLFVVIHAARALFRRHFDGPRWLPWVTGVLVVGCLWFVGWIGYWLVWDERAQLVAQGSAKLIDVVPIFTDPLSRSFLTDEGLNSLLFFMVFFIHMLLPLLMVVGLWLHINRLSRSKWMTSRRMTALILVTLVAMSLIVPATSAEPAQMAKAPAGFTMDWWYMLPLWLVERLSSGLNWAGSLLVGVALCAVPWALTRRKAQTATVEVKKCNDCQKCFNDCPYDAITMVPRSDGRDFEHEASVNPNKCVGCGICSASCDSQGIGLPWLPELAFRRSLEGWIAESDSESPHVAFVCREMAGGVDEFSLPGYQTKVVPCIGWVHMLSIERALRKGAEGVLLAGCDSVGCLYREGPEWTAQRLDGAREPALRSDKVDRAKIRHLRLAPGQRSAMRTGAAAFLTGDSLSPSEPKPPSRFTSTVVGSLLIILFSVITVFFSDLPYTSAEAETPQLVVSFSLAGEASEQCREVSAEELASQPAHMRQTEICERRRQPVRLRVWVDGDEIHSGSYEPSGLSGDNTTVAVERFDVPGTGEHDIEIAVGISADSDEWSMRERRPLAFDSYSRNPVLIDREGIHWPEVNSAD